MARALTSGWPLAKQAHSYPTALTSPVVGRYGWPAVCSIWSGTGSKKSWFAYNSSDASPLLPPEIDQSRLSVALSRLFDHEGLEPGEVDLQQFAAAVSTLGRVSVLAGGPGTGKTTTVARLLALLRDQPGPAPRIALAAPTGKAAARLEEAVRAGYSRTRPGRSAATGRPYGLDAASAARLAALEPKPVPARRDEPVTTRRRDCG